MCILFCILRYGLWKEGSLLPSWIVWRSESFYDQTGQYKVVAENRTAYVLLQDKTIWTSPEDVKVQKAVSLDIDGDREDELVLLCWKTGRYGRHRPFWVEKDEKDWSQHIFVYEYNEGEIRPKWMSSYIGQDVADMWAEDSALSSGRLLLTDPEGQVSGWGWKSWGFIKEETEVSFLVFGDNLIHEPIYRYGLNNDPSFGFLFENVRDLIDKSDVAVIQQETPFTDNPSRYSEYPRFATPSGVGKAIAQAGFDVATCASNHALDLGKEGVDITKQLFDSHGVKCLGIQVSGETEYHPYEIIVRNGARFAMLNYTYGTNGIKIPEENPYMVHLLKDEEQVREDIAGAKRVSDFVIVFVHWGTEYSRETDGFQQKWTQVFLESGVDVAVGTHPHVLQPYEVRKGMDGHEMLVYYSIGNFISAQPEKSCVKGGMAYFTVSLTPDGYRVSDYGLQPLAITWQEGGKYSVGITEIKYSDGDIPVCFLKWPGLDLGSVSP